MLRVRQEQTEQGWSEQHAGQHLGHDLRLGESPGDRSYDPAEQENDGELNKKLNSKMYVVHRLTCAVWTLTESGGIGQDQHCPLTDHATGLAINWALDGTMPD